MESKKFVNHATAGNEKTRDIKAANCWPALKPGDVYPKIKKGLHDCYKGMSYRTVIVAYSDTVWVESHNLESITILQDFSTYNIVISLEQKALLQLNKRLSLWCSDVDFEIF